MLGRDCSIPFPCITVETLQTLAELILRSLGLSLTRNLLPSTNIMSVIFITDSSTDRTLKENGFRA